MKTINDSMRAMGCLLLLAVCLPALAQSDLVATPTSGQATQAGADRTGRAAQTLPASLRPALYRTLAKDAGSAYAIGQDGCVSLPEQSLKACFGDEGVHFTGAGAPLALRLCAYGRDEALSPVRPVRPAVAGDRASYVHGQLTEWWRVLPVGFEQGFTIRKRPGGNGVLMLVLAASGQASEHRQALGWGELRYGKLVVTDANGRVIPATLKSEGNRIRIVVNDAHAVYPITVDPLVWLEQEVSASDGEAGDSFGWSVAVSGTSALIGTPFATVNDNSYQGAAYVFTESNGRWLQAAKLIAGDGASGDQFGMWVALAGTTALVGAPFGNEATGAAYVFGESNGTWAQTAMLTASDGTSGDHFGWSVAFDGTTVLVGAPFATVENHGDQGAAYVFDEANGAWAQTTKLIAADGTANDEFGWSVALDDATALISAYSANNYTGAAYVFGKSAGTWVQTQELTASDGTANDDFGWRIALDGTTALVGADGADGGIGAAYLFSKSAGTWAQMQKLTANDGAPGDDFGWSVALSGPTALIGASYGNGGTGAAYVFSESNAMWVQTQKLIASNGVAFDGFGWSAALEGTTALVGADGAIINGNSFQGAGYFESQSNLSLAESAPQSVSQGQQYVSQTIATNNTGVASPAVAVTVTVPAAASFVSATASQGDCSEASGVVTCDFGQISGNAGTATTNVTLKATGAPGTTIENTTSIAKATPALTASVATGITNPGSCAAGYTEFDGHLDAGGTFTSSPIEVTEAGEKYVDLTSPASFAFFAITNTRYGQHTYVYPHAKHGHRWGAAGSYQVGVQAGPDGGGDYTLCVNLNPVQ